VLDVSHPGPHLKNLLSFQCDHTRSDRAVKILIDSTQDGLSLPRQSILVDFQVVLLRRCSHSRLFENLASLELRHWQNAKKATYPTSLLRPKTAIPAALRRLKPVTIEAHSGGAGLKRK
jgi:hypothetical protein